MKSSLSRDSERDLGIQLSIVKNYIIKTPHLPNKS